MRAIRGRRIGMVVQDPKQGLDPLMTIGSQLVEMLRLHRKAPAAGAYSRALELLAEVHIRDPERVMGLYPHEVSGGMAQRAMLAMILSAESASRKSRSTTLSPKWITPAKRPSSKRC